MKRASRILGAAAMLAASAGMVAAAAGGSQAASPATIAYAGGWQTNGIVNPQPQANGDVVQTGLAYSPLAYYKFTTNYGYWPVLAKSWQVKDNGNQVVIHLNPKAKWSNGTPVTANDVYVTFELQFVVGNAQSWGLTHLRVVNPHTIVFYKNPKFLYSTVFLLQQILNNNNILPAADFSRFVPAHFWNVVSRASGNPNAKATKKALAVLSKAATTLEGYNFGSPSALIYDGPWSFSRTSSSEQLYVKNPDFVFANRINAQDVLAINQTTNDVTWRALEDGKIDYAGVAFSPPVYKAVMRVHQNHYIAAPQSTGMSIMFNQTVYPWNMLKVRQALAYMINRPAARRVGEPIGSVSVKIPDGMITAETKQWLSPAQIKSLNPYTYNPAKGAALLKSAGFKKTAKGWVMPNGKPFQITFYAPNFSDWDAGLQEITSQLSSLGIHAQDDFMDTTAYYSSTDGASTGKFPVMSRWWGGWGLPPFDTYNQVYVVDDGWAINNHGQLIPPTTKHVHNAPTTMTVPGVGTIHPQKLVVAVEGNLPLPKEKADVYKLAKSYNYWLPAIPVWNQQAGRTYSTAHWVWPNFKANRALLNQFTYQTPFVVYEILGLMHPKA